MHIEYLYYYKKFADNLSITKTAAGFYMTPQGLSRALHQLEKEFGVKLLLYNGNAVSLTEAGEKLRNELDRFLGLFEQVKHDLAQYELVDADKTRESATVLVTPFVSRYILGMFDLQKPGLFPGRVMVSEAVVYRLIPRLTSDKLETGLGIVSFPRTERFSQMIKENVDRGNLTYIPLMTSPLIVLVSAYSKLAKKESLQFDDIAHSQIVRLRDDVLADALDEVVQEDRVSTVTSSTSVIYEQIVSRQAVSFAPKLVERMAVLPSDIRTKTMNGLFETETGIVIPEQSQSSLLVSKISQYMIESVRSLSSLLRYAETFTPLC